MSERAEHRFQFQGRTIARAAEAEAEYHEDRSRHWQGRLSASLARVEATISAKIVRHGLTGGQRAFAEVEFGDPVAWTEYQLAEGKIETHRRAAASFRSDAQVYGTQDRAYELDPEDVLHFRLGGQPREDD